MEGPAPSELDILRRARLARMLLDSVAARDWREGGQLRVEEASVRIEAARSRCLELLPSVIARRRRDRAEEVPRWQESGAKALRLLLDTPAGPAEWVATQLSAVGTDAAEVGSHSRVLAPDRARAIQRRLCAGEDFLELLPEGGLVAWAPSSPAALGRLLARCLRIPPDILAARPLRLVVPMPLTPGCVTVAAIKDLWWHACLGEKWAPMICDQAYVPQPMRLLTSATSG